MNTDQLAGKWDQIKGDIQKTWGKLTDDHLLKIKGDSTKLAGIVREQYGISKEEAEAQVEDFLQKAKKQA